MLSTMRPSCPKPLGFWLCANGRKCSVWPLYVCLIILYLSCIGIPFARDHYKHGAYVLKIDYVPATWRSCSSAVDPVASTWSCSLEDTTDMSSCIVITVFNYVTTRYYFYYVYTVCMLPLVIDFSLMWILWWPFAYITEYVCLYSKHWTNIKGVPVLCVTYVIAHQTKIALQGQAMKTAGSATYVNHNGRSVGR